jgi:hypothetical protein
MKYLFPVIVLSTGMGKTVASDLGVRAVILYRAPNVSLGSLFHHGQRLRGLGGQGAELGILRRCDLRRWGGQMHPAGLDGKRLLSSGPVCARPRLPALTTLAPEPRHRGAIGQRD